MGTRSEERTEFLSDIITTAVEGGVNYWARVEQYQYVMNGELTVYCGEQAGEGTRATIVDTDDGKSYELTVDSIATAIGKITNGDGVKYADGAIRENIATASRENDAGEIDADLADTIVQVAAMGEVVYG